jgi:hypothetical protein
MGFVLSVLYFVVNYFTPAALFGPLAAEAHIEMIVAALIVLVSLPELTKSFIFKTAQPSALVGLAFAVALSVLFGVRWPGGAIRAFFGFMPFAFGYILVCLHCNSRKKLQGIVLMLLFVCLFVITQGCVTLLHGVPEVSVHDMNSHEAGPVPQENATIPYLLVMRNDAGELFYRLKGLGEINDPNDFGQLLVCVIPLVFIFWRPKKFIQNFAFVILPASALLYGMFLTHSRGALLALGAMGMVAGRRRIGTLPALLLTGGFIVGAMALHFTGGRDISAETGADRTALWSEGLQLLKSHPLFGVGAGNMPNLTESHHTAHNSVVVCAAEMGLVGLYFWSLFLFSTVRDALTIASSKNVSEGAPTIAEETLFPQVTRAVEEVSKLEVNRMGRLLVLSFTGYLVAGWFLSRAIVMTLFLLGGMVEVVYEMALRRGMVAPRMRLARTLRYAGGLAVVLLLAMYITLRAVNLAH